MRLRSRWLFRQDEFLLTEDRTWAAVGRSADFAEPYQVHFPADVS